MMNEYIPVDEHRIPISDHMMEIEQAVTEVLLYVPTAKNSIGPAVLKVDMDLWVGIRDQDGYETLELTLLDQSPDYADLILKELKENRA